MNLQGLLLSNVLDRDLWSKNPLGKTFTKDSFNSEETSTDPFQEFKIAPLLMRTGGLRTRPMNI